VINNVVIANSCWASSVHNSLFADNSVVEDAFVSTPGCTATVAFDDKTQEGASSSNTVVRNNLASQFSVYNRLSRNSGRNIGNTAIGRRSRF
jgi:hypothetical protein